MLSRTHFEGAGHALLNTSIYVIEVLPKERRASLSFMAGRVGFAIGFFITGLGKKWLTMEIYYWSSKGLTCIKHKTTSILSFLHLLNLAKVFSRNILLCH